MAKLPEIKNVFNAATLSQAKEITALQAEVERLRAARSAEVAKPINSLSELLVSVQGESNVLIEAIVSNPYQPRQIFDANGIKSLAKSLDKDGLICPLILIPQEETFLVWDGHRRLEAAKMLGWEQIKSVFLPEPENLHRQALITFLHHEDLNPLDKAEAVVKELVTSTSLDEPKIATTLNALLQRLKRKKSLEQLGVLLSAAKEPQMQGLAELGVSELEQQLVLALFDLNINPASFAANLLPLLSLQPDLILAIRQQGLKGAQALALKGLNGKSLNTSPEVANAERIKATKSAIAEKLTVAQTQILVRQIKEKFSPKTSSTATVTKLARFLSQTDLNNLDVQEKSEIIALLKSKINELEQSS